MISIRTRRAAAGALAVATIAAGVSTVTAPAAGAAPVDYGAIAVSRSGSVGKSWDYASAGAARQAALARCGYGTCKVLASFSNGCGAVAATPRMFGGGAARDLRTAERRAIAKSGGGIVRTWVCTSRHL
ncbi:DUF4189 domain-containing protein [Tsukamurella sp. 8F]|uniref:DUF4189 domain-containing protein n=1 Tax=unclassified Tsukamurella TaxID=2633480 RepID=UPI0023B9E920|nr:MULTISPECIES: DUF4189 domain-containing protein [unclassified Tsukamurella]MDF0532410.1 DUF4189 domain-containing protein [Tsukamurella sp. 8J]MDF0586916.1 DUF4189 domain-containing protein [Tsukamurella sp. 8F]